MRKGRRLSFAVVNAQSDFLAELYAGDAIRLETTIIEMGTKLITFRHRLIRAENDMLAFETVFKCVLLNLEKRSSSEIPAEVRAKASHWIEGS